VHNRVPCKKKRQFILYHAFRCTEKQPPIQEVIDCEVIPRFVELMQREDSRKLQFEATWALTNIASGTSAHTMSVLNSGAVPIFIRNLSSPDDNLLEQSIWALGNIAGDSVSCRDMLLGSGAMPSLLAVGQVIKMKRIAKNPPNKS